MIINSGNLTILNRAFNAAFKEGFGQAPADHKPLTLETPSGTKTEEYGWLGQVPSLREWIGERVSGGIKEHGYVIRNRKFESTIEVARDSIEDDQYGVYMPLFAELGRAAAAHPCEMVFGALKKGFAEKCYDGQYFFDTDHPIADGTMSNTGGGADSVWVLADCSRMVKPVIFQRRRDYHIEAMTQINDEHVFNTDNFRYGVDARVEAGYGLWQLAYGSKQDLSGANYEAARVALQGMEGDEGRPMGVRPTHLFVPPSLEKEGLELLNAERLASGATNVYKGTAMLVVSPWLS